MLPGRHRVCTSDGSIIASTRQVAESGWRRALHPEAKSESLQSSEVATSIRTFSSCCDQEVIWTQVLDGRSGPEANVANGSLEMSRLDFPLHGVWLVFMADHNSPWSVKDYDSTKVHLKASQERLRADKCKNEHSHIKAPLMLGKKREALPVSLKKK